MVSGMAAQSVSGFQKAKLNPFDEYIVKEPREVTYSVKGLNEIPLQLLIDEFSALEIAPVPRGLVKMKLAQLVTSPTPGYGKSHFLGMLFKKLDDRSTQIYLRPFQDPEKVWHSILLTTVQELERTDNPGEETETNPLQIEAFARGVLVHLVADYIDQGEVADYPQAKEAVQLLREKPLEVCRITSDYKNWAEWIRGIYENPNEFSKLKNKLRQRLSDQAGQVSLGGRESAWLKILYAYAYSPKNSSEREVVLKWLRAEPLEEEEVKLLKLAQADNDAKGDMSAGEINALSLTRLKGLCALAGFYRPFLFCFDQTEFYSCDAALIKRFGATIEEMVDAIPNQMTVVTANEDNWSNDLRPKIESSHRERFSRPISLQQISLEQSRELIRSRLEGIQLDYRHVEQFCAAGWLERQFEHGAPAIRRILSAAADRFLILQGKAAEVIAEVKVSKPLDLESLLKTKINEIRTRKPLQAYNQDVLMWWTQDLSKGVEGRAVSRHHEWKFFNTSWADQSGKVYFAYEAGEHYKRWESIIREAESIGKAAEGTLFVIMRTPDLPKFPKPAARKTTALVDDARRKGLVIRELTLDQVCEMYAARDLFSDAYQGNIDHEPDAVLLWLQKRFQKQIDALSEGIRQTPDPKPKVGPTSLTAAQTRIVIEFVERKRFVSIKAVLKELKDETLQPAVLNAIGNHPNIKAHSGPQTILLQWRVTQ